MVRKGTKSYKRAQKKERSGNLVGENRELSIVLSEVTNSAIGINAQVVVARLPSRIFRGYLADRSD